MRGFGARHGLTTIGVDIRAHLAMCIDDENTSKPARIPKEPPDRRWREPPRRLTRPG
jgi:hypothetical protein